jgi:hypothetical protein
MSRFTEKVGTRSGDGDLVFVKPSDLARAGFNGVIAEGKFVEALPNQFDEAKNDFKIEADVELEIEGVDKNGDKYVKKIKEGDTLVVNAAGNLGYLMKSLSPGELCQISYFGKKPIAKGKLKGTMTHTFEVMK